MGLKNVLQPKQEIDYVSFSFQGTRLMLTECDKSFFWLLFFIVIDFLIFFFYMKRYISQDSLETSPLLPPTSWSIDVDKHY